MRHDIEERAAPDRIVDDVPMRSHPQRHVLAVDARGDVGRRNEAAIAHAAGEPRRLRPEQTAAHCRMNPVGADDDIAFDLASVGKARDGAVAIGDHGDAARRGPDECLRQRARQDVEEIRPMHREMRRAELGRRGRHRLARNGPAVAPAPHDLPFRGVADRDHVALEPERAKRLHGIGAEADACADLAEARRLLVDGHLHAAPVQRQRSGKSADPAADDCNPLCSHRRSLRWHTLRQPHQLVRERRLAMRAG